MRFGVLGPIAAWTDEGRPVPISGAKVRALLADLLVHRGEPVTGDRLVDDLWGEAPDSTNPAGLLSSKASQLRRALDAAEPGARELVVSPPPGYTLAVAPEAVDAELFVTLLDEAGAAGDPAGAVDRLERALALWRGPAYGEVADLDFARGEVSRLDERRLTAQEALARARLDLGEHARVADELTALVDAHPWREDLRLSHVLALYRAGRQRDALAGFETYRRHLRDELGIEPSSAAAALHHAVLGQDPALDLPPAPAPASEPALGAAVPAAPRGRAPGAGEDRRPEAHPGRATHRPAARLPALRTELVGRDGEVAALAAVLGGPGLVTLAGPGGVGKTTLALAAARRVADAHPDGAWFVDLSTVEPDGAADLVADVVGDALALRPASEAPAPAPAGSVGWVAGALRGHRLVLVLDNCEHVVEAAAALADQLLRDAPGVTVLVTSREPLGVPGELVRPVAPLAVPGPRDQGTPDVVAGSAAVQLFVARARAAGAEVTVDARTAPLLGTLCRRLDGLPLALELAATRAPALGLPAVVARLGDRFRLLGSGRRAGPERHRTLEAMLDWSWELLDDDERRALRRLAVHADGCTLAAAAAVGSGPPPGGDDSAGVTAEGGDLADTADVLARLVERSLVVADHRPSGIRFRLLESIGAYGGRRLAEAGEVDAARRRHLDWYVDVAERADAALRGPDQERWLAVLDAESANAQAALDTAVEHGLADHAERLVAALGWYWSLRSRTGSALRSLDRALAVDGGRGTAPSLARARAQAFRLAAVLTRGDARDHVARRSAVLDAFDGLDAPIERGRAAALIGSASLDAGLVAEGEALLDEAASTAVAEGDRWGEAVALSGMCLPAHIHGDADRLEARAMRAEELFADVGDAWGRLVAGEWLGAHAELVGDLDRGVKLLEAGLDEAERLGLWRNVAGRLGLLGWIAHQREDWPAAAALGEQTHRLAVEQGDRSLQVLAGMVRAFTARQTGDLAGAEAHLRELLTSSDVDPEALVAPTGRRGDAGLGGTGDLAPHVASVALELGYVAELQGEPERALALHRAVLAAARAAGYPRDLVGALEGAAAALSARGDHASAARVLGAATRARTDAQLPLAAAEQRDVDRALERVVDALGRSEADRLLAEGRTLGPDGVTTDLG